MRRRFYILLLCGCAFVATATWLSSGTLAPYANTLPRPLILKPCNYLLNTDHPHFEATFLLLEGAPAETWNFSVVLRRTLFPLLAWPMMKAWGFVAGGVATSATLQVAAFAIFVIYVRRRIGDAAAVAAVALLATYPGIYYWAGLPYSYAIIVPATLLATIAAREIDAAQSLARVAVLSLLLGVLFLGYDLMAYFAPAVVMILLLRRRLGWIVPAVVLMALPGVINTLVLKHVAGVDFANENSRFYATILQAYANPPGLITWAKHVSPVFASGAKVYFFSNFTFLPALFLGVLAINLVRRRGAGRVQMERVELWVLLTALGLFLFINLAPPYRGWQFRGHGMARLYQPVFAVMLLYVLRVLQATVERGGSTRPWLIGGICVAAAINASIALGPITANPLAGWAYHAFYRHAQSPQMRNNLALFGRRPLGVCDQSITIENPPPKRKGPKKPLTRAQKERLRQAEEEKLRLQQQATTLPATTPPPTTSPAGDRSTPAGGEAPSPGG